MSTDEKTKPSAELLPVGEYVFDELKSRDWTTAYAATLIDGDEKVNELWLDLLCCLPIWEKHNILFSESEAKRLEQLFGLSAQFWLNIHASYLSAKGKP